MYTYVVLHITFSPKILTKRQSLLDTNFYSVSFSSLNDLQLADNRNQGVESKKSSYLKTE